MDRHQRHTRFFIAALFLICFFSKLFTRPDKVLNLTMTIVSNRNPRPGLAQMCWPGEWAEYNTRYITFVYLLSFLNGNLVFGNVENTEKAWASLNIDILRPVSHLILSRSFKYCKLCTKYETNIV